MITFERKTFEQARLEAADRKVFFSVIVACVCSLVGALASLPLPDEWFVISWFLLSAAGFAVSYWLFYGRRRQKEHPRRDNRDRWVESTATVVNAETSIYEGNYGKKWTRYFLLIHFSANELEVHLRARVDKPFYDRTQTGDILPIRYDPEDISVALLAGETGFEDLCMRAK